MVIASTPVFLTSIVSFSADGTLNAFALFFVAYILHCNELDKIKIVDKIILMVGSVVLALSKVIYFPLAFLVWIIPNEKLSKKPLLYKICNSLMAILSFLIWFLIAKTYLFPNSGVDPDNQMKYVLAHIGSFILISLKTIGINIIPWAKSMFGSVLYDSQVYLSNIIWIGFAVITIFCFIPFKQKRDENNKGIKIDKIVIAGILLVIVGLTFASLYVQWTPYKNSVIEGIQGRYFIPLIYPVAYLIKKKDENKKFSLAIMISVILLDFIAAINMYQVYA